MTVQEAISKARAAISTDLDDDIFVAWLSNLDGHIFNNVVSRHEGADLVAHGPYTTADDMSTELMVAAPYSDDVYVEYLKARINHHLSEIAKANNSMMLHNSELDKYAANYTRTHLPSQPYYFRGCTLL